MDEEIALGEQFTALEAEEYGSDSESDSSSNNGEDEEGMDIGPPTCNQAHLPQWFRGLKP